MLKDNLSVVRVSTPTSGTQYRYLISSSSTSYRAFRSYKGFKQWLKDHNLRIDGVMRKEGHGKDTWYYATIKGSIHEQMSLWSQQELDSVGPNAIHRIDLCNGDYVDYKIVHLVSGGCASYCLNPNVRDRKTYSYEAYRSR